MDSKYITKPHKGKTHASISLEHNPFYTRYTKHTSGYCFCPTTYGIGI